MKLHKFLVENSYDNFNYIIEFENKAIAVDPFDSNFIVEKLDELKLDLDSIIITHSHFDHIKGVEDLVDWFGVKVYAYENSEILFDIGLKEGDTFGLDNNSYIEIIYTPGHISDHICLKIFENELLNYLISGDTLFNCGVGNVNSGNLEELYESIQRIKELDKNVIICPAHDYLENNLKFALSLDSENSILKDYLCRLPNELTLADEMRINPFLKCNSFEEFVKLRKLRDEW